jgi:hypothetical protein
MCAVHSSRSIEILRTQYGSHGIALPGNHNQGARHLPLTQRNDPICSGSAEQERGRDVQNKYIFALFAAFLAVAFTSEKASGQVSRSPDFNIQASLVGSVLTCSQTPPTIRVPPPLVARARLKARLATLLRDSLDDDTRGIVNIAREREIRKLANKLGGGNNF